MESTVYDYAIIGAGAAGLHLALAFAEDPYFNTMEILVIEKSQKNTNDRTWCFWEKGAGKWDSLVHQSWEHAQFITSNRSAKLNLGEYTYKMIQAIDFYTMAKDRLRKAPNITWLQDEVLSIVQGAPNLINTTNHHVKAKHLFDSQIAPDFYSKDHGFTNLLQHFKGWVIETEEDVFDLSTFVMMDFRLKYPDTTSFIYILPQTSRKALVEFTFFSPALVRGEDYDHYLKTYIRDILKLTDFKIVSVEQGVIPMSNYPFHKLNTNLITKIGTAGSWVKGSSGYSFKNAERYSAKILENIKQGFIPSHRLFKSRFKNYDTLFLDVLYNYNHLGEQIFSDMYYKNPIGEIFAFLDEETSPLTELKIIYSFKWWPFSKALVRHLFS